MGAHKGLRSLAGGVILTVDDLPDVAQGNQLVRPVLLDRGDHSRQRAVAVGPEETDFATLARVPLESSNHC